MISFRRFSHLLLLLFSCTLFTLAQASSAGVGVGFKGGWANYEAGGIGSTYGIHLEGWVLKYLALEISGDLWQKNKEILKENEKFWYDRSFSLTIKGLIYPFKPIPLVIYPGFGFSTDKMWETLHDPNIGESTYPYDTGGPHILVGIEYAVIPYINLMMRIERRWLFGGELFYPHATYLYGGIVFTSSPKN